MTSLRREFICAYCGCTFLHYESQKRGRQIFCSSPCMNAAKRRVLDLELIKALYVGEGLSAAAIGRRFGVSDTVIRKRLAGARIQIRPPSVYRTFWVPRVFSPTLTLGGLREGEKGYLAAFIDGDGSIGLYRKSGGGVCPAVNMSNTHLGTITHIAGVLGDAAIRSCTRPLGYRPIYRVDVRSVADVLHLLEVLYPYFITKRHQAEVAMRFCRRKLAQFARGDFAVVPEDWLAHEEMRQLNMAGGRGGGRRAHQARSNQPTHETRQLAEGGPPA